jgi:glycosyltransferase involved in cell wall biosynthesis
MLGVVVPAHDEEQHIGDCLQALRMATRCPQLNGEKVLIVVALDACTDQTERIARSWGAATIAVDARNVGIARARGAKHALDAGAKHALDAGARWLAFTDADSIVAPDWLSAQLAQHSDAVCGTIEVRDWGSYGESMRLHHAETYTDADGHRHIHGANFGVTAEAYEGVGGFQPLISSEDVALVEALHLSGASIAWSAAPRVVTSARREYRAPGGFGETLRRVEMQRRVFE